MVFMSKVLCEVVPAKPPSAPPKPLMAGAALQVTTPKGQGSWEHQDAKRDQWEALEAWFWHVLAMAESGCFALRLSLERFFSNLQI